MATTKDINPDTNKPFTQFEADAQNVVEGQRVIGVPGAAGLNTTGASSPSLSLGSMSNFGISASLPAINADDIRKQTEAQFGSQRDILKRSLNQRIADAEGLSADEKRTLEGQLGTGRRFSSSAQAFIKFTDDENKKKVAELELQRDEALANFDYKLASLVDSRISQERQHQQQNFDNILKVLDVAEKQQKASAEKTKLGIQSAAESTIATLVTKGITDPVEIFNTLNPADATGSRTVNVSSETVDKVLKNLTTNGKASNLPSDIQTFEWLRKNNRLPSAIAKLPEGDQYFAYLNMQKLAESGKLSSAASAYGGGSVPVRVGAGASNSTEETIIRSRLFSRLMSVLNKGAVSDSDRAVIDSRINELRNAGLGEQEILDQLSGFSTSVKTPYNNTFRDLVVSSTDDLDKQTQLMSKVSTLLNAENYKGAMNAVENAAMTQAFKLDGGNYMGTATATTYLSNVERIRKLIQDNISQGFQISTNIPAGKGSAGVGPVTGSFQNLLGRLKGKQATQIKAELTNLYASFRKENAGSAVTDSEMRFLDPLFASITDKKGNFMEKLDAFERQLLQRYNSTRASVSLPTVSSQQAIDPAQRLKLYEKGEVMEVGGTIDDFLNAPIPSSEVTWQMAPDEF